ncbi:hypothetical protein FPZ43_16400 [Mucilaginibacter pallidiroseus]|uniref:Carboxypeptidase regulatory-like domain-containing protein n=1 Tax=Mucilaginibacter pallidiroseus TaxID=2599295 RepID=A0A563U3D8_9SPHI|nr:carboxypeptidase-like regulatory domain-containing protein [Mucilaginibacter pallidiroseus]TWR25861.1 hypothetical protein FPZ43_16400 [Mucilaginibacter pallidiroseus]
MKKSSLLRIFLPSILTTLFFNALAQSNVLVGVKKTVQQVESFYNKKPSEKIYLHFDKPYYAVNDTAWFKGYVTNGQGNAPSKLSAKLYIELFNDSAQVIKRFALPVNNGLAAGYLAMDSATIWKGNYTVRAYTSWTRNFGEEYFFHQQFNIGDASNNGWLFNAKQSIKPQGTNTNVGMAIDFTNIKAQPIISKNVDIQVVQGSKKISSSKQNTGSNGKIDLNFNIPANADNVVVLIRDAVSKKQIASIPVYPALNKEVDLQFMPEGGNMVAGLYNRIGFKAIGQNGLGVDVEGVVVDSKNKPVSTLQSQYKGIGSFSFVPQAAETYKAIIKFNGTQKTVSLPALESSGVVMRANSVTNRDSVFVYLNSNNTTIPQGAMLIGQSRDQVFYGAPVTFNKNSFSVGIPKNIFPAGVVRFSLLNADAQPLAERAVFIEQPDNLAINVAPSLSKYSTRDSVALTISVTDKLNKPVTGSFSVSVTDDSQVAQQQYANNIMSNLLLTSDLKGNIETPAWYFKDTTLEVKRQLDNLMLTQAWVGYSWDKITAPLTEPVFAAEPTNGITGKLTNLLNKPVADTKVYLVATGGGAFFADTVSNKDGYFAFNNLPISDTIGYTFRLKNSKGKNTNAKFTIDDFKPAAYTDVQKPFAPLYASNDTTVNNYLLSQNQAFHEKRKTNFNGINQLETVIINGQKNVRVNNNFLREIDGIDEKELIAAGDKTLMDLIYIRLRGFREARFFANNISSRPVDQGYSRFVINQVAVDDIFVDNISLKGMFGTFFTDPMNGAAMAYIKELLNYVPASSVKSIKLYGPVINVIFITTRGGHGPWIKPTRGLYVYHPLPFQTTRKFYQPRYAANENTGQPDLRSTIFWEPNMVTDANGKATLSFYTADKPGTYTINVQGTDLNGRFGVYTSKIKVQPRQTQ